MSVQRRWRGLAARLLVVASVVLAVSVVPQGVDVAGADTVGPITFEAPTYSTGSVNTQNGWIAPNGCAVYDQAVVANTTAPASFGLQSWRFSNAGTSGCFEGPFSPSTTDEAGETSAVNNGLSGGTRRTHFVASWDFASTVPTAEQPGLGITASPDRGDGARMSYVRMEDAPAGLRVLFYDYQRSIDPECNGPGDPFVPTYIATGLSRATAHNIRIEMDFIDGPANDVVRVYVDNALVHTGTSWEDYFRDCEGNPTRPVDSLLFRASGTAAPATAGQGFLIDNLSISTFDPPPPAIIVTKNVIGTPSPQTDFGVRVTCTDQDLQVPAPVVIPDFVFTAAGGTLSEDLAPGDLNCSVAEYDTGFASTVQIACAAENPPGQIVYAECLTPTTFRIDATALLRARLYGAITITVTNTFNRVPPPPPPPPPPPAHICNKQTVTVDLAQGQSPTAGPDVIRGTAGNDVINALGGDDNVCALGGEDTINGGPGADRLFGAGGNDIVNGNAGNDTLRGRAGNDVLRGGAGTDTCWGGTGTDTAAGCETTREVP